MPQTAIQNSTGRTATMPARLLMVPIAGYRRFVSPLLPPRCRFAPSCSEYALTAVAEHGAARGLWLAVKRIARDMRRAHMLFNFILIQLLHDVWAVKQR